MAVVELEVHLTRDEDTVVERAGAVEGRRGVGRELDDTAEGALVVVEGAADDSSVLLAVALGGERVGLPGDLCIESASAASAFEECSTHAEESVLARLLEDLGVGNRALEREDGVAVLVVAGNVAVDVGGLSHCEKC